MRQGVWCGLVCLLAALPGATNAQTEAAAKDALAFFESRIRPLLAEHCYACHSGRADKLGGGLRLDGPEHLLRGGDSGAVVIPGNPDDSALIKAVRYDALEMPPQRKLAAADIGLLEKWVRLGAPFPDTPAGHAGDNGVPPADHRANFKITDSDRTYWAYQPLRRPPIPSMHDPKRFANPIDAFVLDRLEQNGITPNPVATPRALVRRLSFDLTGLPPDFDSIERFAADPSDEAWSQLIDDALARPTYGERWGRHWLDIVRYAQTNGYERDAEKPFAWRYRDYVIQSFNEDKPFDQFIIEQLAGDEMPGANGESLIATAFYRLGVWDDEPDDAQAAEFDGLDDILATIGQVFLGQNIGCARCHNHMFDPISQREYYQLLSFIRNIKPYEKPRFKLDSSILAPLASPEFLTRWHAQQADTLSQLRQRRQRLGDDERSEREAIDMQMQAVRDAAPEVPWTLAVRDRKDVQPTHVLIRGNAQTPGDRVAAGFPAIFAGVDSADLRRSNAAAEDLPARGRRLALARWIASPKHPLTARVLANRVWQHHFGRGIAASPNDFGRAGTEPTHPDLLNWLAVELSESGWSIGHLHRLILSSNTWRMSSRADNLEAMQVDPGNRLLWRQNAVRLDAEAIRDAMLSVSGKLNLEAGGRGFYPRLEGEVVAGQSKPGFGWGISTEAQRTRRSVYSYLKRGLRDPLMESFDYTNTDSSLDVRPTTTVAPQALMLLNSRFVLEQARALANEVSVRSDHTANSQIEILYRRLFGRLPTRSESAIARRYLASQEDQFSRLADMVSFRPAVPVSLYSEYRRRLAPEQYLFGPRTGWSYHPGKWRAGYESIESVDRHRGPFALCTDVRFSDGSVHGKLRLDDSTELASLLMRARPTGDTYSGVAFTLDPRHGQIIVTTRGGKLESRFNMAWQPVTKRWLPFRIDSSATSVRLSLATATPIEVEVPEELVGHFGVATWGGSIDFDELRIDPNGAMPQGWTRYGGRWVNAPDGTWTVAPDAGAKVVRTYERIDNGEVSVDLRMTPGKAAMGGLLLRVNDAKVGADNWHGYEIRLDAGSQAILLGKHGNNWQQLESRPFQVVPGKWHRLRVAINGSLIAVYADDSPDIVFRFSDPNPLPAGFVGLGTWDSEMTFRNLEVRSGGHVTHGDFRPPRPFAAREVTSPRRRALESFCQVLMNLNEFVYVD